MPPLRAFANIKISGLTYVDCFSHQKLQSQSPHDASKDPVLPSPV